MMKLNPNAAILGRASITPSRCETQTSPLAKFGVKEGMGQWGSAIARFLLRGGEPTISQKRDCAGNLYYKVYDPVTQQHYTFDSEREVRIWLEERYNLPL